MNTLKYLILSTLSVLFAFNACTSDSSTNDSSPSLEQLQGKWDLTSAMRDQEATSSLEGTYMQFDDSKMTCNFIGETVNSDFSLENNQLVQGAQTYKIESFTPEQMIVSTQLMDYDFKLTFTRSIE